MEAFDEADVVGIRGSANFNEEHQMWVERISRLFELRVTAGRDPAYVTHCLLNNTLRDSLGTLLAGQSHVSIISSRDLAPRLQADYGIEDVRVYQVPSQYVMREGRRRLRARLHGVPIWPDAIDRIRGELDGAPARRGLPRRRRAVRQGTVHPHPGAGRDRARMGSCLDGWPKGHPRARPPQPYRPPAAP